jgi:hypothetical protein
MNARPFIKSARALMVASGLIAASTVAGYAQDSPVPLGAQATVALSSLYVSAPAGMANLGGHSFDLSGGNLIPLNNGQSASVSGSWANAKAVYLLLNSYNTYMWFDQTPIGNITITFSDGTTTSANLTVGYNIREWRIGSGYTIDSVTDTTPTSTDPTYTTENVWTGSAQPSMGGGSAVMDMLTFTLPGNKTVTNIAINDTNPWGAIRIDLAGLTIETQNPDPICVRPGASCNTPAAQNSQAWKWQPLLPGASNTNPHSH